MNKMYLEKTEDLKGELISILPEIRQNMNISQTELGEMVGLSSQTISAIERNAKDLSWNNFLSLMKVLSVIGIHDSRIKMLDSKLNEVICQTIR